MDQQERDHLQELCRSADGEAKLMALYDRATPDERVEIREFVAGWYSCVNHLAAVNQFGIPNPPEGRLRVVLNGEIGQKRRAKG